MSNDNDKMPQSKDEQQKEIAKAYGKYANEFTPKPPCFANCVKAFFIGGAICGLSLGLQNILIDTGMKQQTAATYVTVVLIMLAQLLTGLGVFDSIAKFAGAGVIVPITGFANSMVAPALEYKREGPSQGVAAIYRGAGIDYKSISG